MNEEEIIKELFDKSALNYATEGIEETVLKKIAIKNVYRKKQQTYDLIGKIGLFVFLFLCLIFTMTIREVDMLYLYLGAPFILLLLMFPLEILFRQKFYQKIN